MNAQETIPGGGSPPAHRRRRMVLLGAIVMVALVYLGIRLVVTATDSPERAVREYLDAIVAGNYEAATEIAPPATGSRSWALWDDDIAAAVPEGRIDGYTIRDIEVTGTGTAEVSVVLEAGDHDGSLTLRARPDGAVLGIRHGWTVSPQALLQRLTVTGGADVLVNGVPLTIPGAETEAGQMLVAPPGVYEIEHRHPSDLVQSIPAVHDVGLTEVNRPRAGRARFELGPDGADQVRELVHEHLEGCFAVPAAERDVTCPDLVGSEDPDLDWRIVEHPTVGTSVHDAGGGTYATDSDATIEATDENGQLIRARFHGTWGLLLLDDDGELTIETTPYP